MSLAAFLNCYKSLHIGRCSIDMLIKCVLRFPELLLAKFSIC